MNRNPAEIAIGPMLLGTVFNICLYGMMVVQTYSYYTQRQSGERSWIKFVVGFLFLADTVNSVFMLVYLYSTLIINFGSVDKLTRSTWVFDVEPISSGAIATCVQLFYGWRIQKLIKKEWITCIICIFSVIGGLSAVASSIAAIKVPDYVEWHRFEAAVTLWLGSAIVADITIASSLVWFFRGRKSGVAATDDIVNRLIKSTLQTGMLTSIFACVDLATFLAIKDGTHLIFNVPLSKLYTNSFMAMLNSRINDGYSSEKAATRGDSTVVDGLQLTTVCRVVSTSASDLPPASIFDGRSEIQFNYV